MRLKSVRNKVFFLHVPKCGGTSIDSAFDDSIEKNRTFKLNAAYSKKASDIYYNDIVSNNEREHHLKFYRQALLIYAMLSKKFYISGHFVFNKKIYDYFHDDYYYITLLRDPVKRWISQYLYNRYKKHSNHFKIKDDIETYIKSDIAIRTGSIYTHYFSDIDPQSNVKKRINSAINNILLFDYVGFLEKIDNFIFSLNQQLELNLQIKLKNTSPVDLLFRENLITSDIYKKIEKLCEADIEIYNYTKNYMIL